MQKNFSSYTKAILLMTFVLASHSSKGDSLKVLFLGNSHTFWHNVPQLTSDLALSNGDTLFFEANTPGGCTLGHPENGHLYNSTSLALIDSLDWDYVIMQEHSLFAVIDYYRDTYMYPGAKSLDSLIKLNNPCTETIVQLIWSKKNGGEHCINQNCSIEFEDFSHMQDSLTAEYSRLADTISCTLSPVGAAWKQSIENGDPIELFDPDESHPSLAGSYLAACVHYATMFQKSPLGLTYWGGLNPEDAYYFQQIAYEIVLSDPALWNINGNIPSAGFEKTQINNTVFFTDTSINGDFYSWDFGDGTMDTVQNPVHTYDSAGTFIISQEVGNLCDSDITTDAVIINLTNVSPNSDIDQNIRIIHGEVLGTFRVVSNFSGIHQIKIFNTSGILVHVEATNRSPEISLDISHLPHGFYIFSIYANCRIENLKLTY